MLHGLRIYAIRNAARGTHTLVDASPYSNVKP
jgi:hypothetical protein